MEEEIMSKLYVARMIVLDPNNIHRYSNALSKYSTEEILVKKGFFGYQEVFTGFYFLWFEKSVDMNYDYNRHDYPFVVLDYSIVLNLRLGHKQFVLDSFKNFPLREALEKDVEEYIARFETSSLKLYCDEVEKKQQEKQNIKSSKKKARQLVRKWKSENQK